MKHLFIIRRTALIVLSLFFSAHISAQDLFNIDVEVTSVAHNHQCCNDAACFCGGFPTFCNDAPEPRYRVRTRSSYTGTPATYSGTTIINLGTSSCGTYSRSDVVANMTGICADQVQFEVEMWEEDGCGSDNTFDNNCVNDDESRTNTTYEKSNRTTVKHTWSTR